MAYASGSLIAATDYNTFVANHNAIWSTGTGNSGYGQTALATVAATNTITATQWSSLIAAMNKALAHQNNTSSGVTSPVAGNTVAYAAALSTASTSVTSNKLLAGSVGTTVTGTNFAATVTVANTTAAVVLDLTRTVTFASADAARYFFNAGGKLNFVVSSITNTGGTTRGASLVTLGVTNFGSLTNFAQGNNGGRTGTGATVTTNNTAIGYYGLTTTQNAIVNLTGTTAAYTSDNLQLLVFSNGTVGANADKGSVLSFRLVLTSAAQNGINDSVNVTANHRIDIIPPESTNLTNTWGIPTIA
jgi:hypothetical protein